MVHSVYFISHQVQQTRNMVHEKTHYNENTHTHTNTAIIIIIIIIIILPTGTSFPGA